MKKYISLAKALAAVMSMCLVLSCAISPIRAEFEYQPVKAEVPLNCTMTGSIESTFEFVMETTGKDCPKPQQDVVSVNGSGTANFVISIDEPGTYQYKVYERAGDNDKIIYDETVFFVTLFVTTDDKGTLDYQVILAKEGNVKPTEVAFVNDAIREPERKDPIVKTGDMTGHFQNAAWVFIAAGASLLLLAPIKRKETDYEE